MVKPHPIEERIEQLAKLKQEALHAGSAAAVQRQHDRLSREKAQPVAARRLQAQQPHVISQRAH